MNRMNEIMETGGGCECFACRLNRILDSIERVYDDVLDIEKYGRENIRGWGGHGRLEFQKELYRDDDA